MSIVTDNRAPVTIDPSWKPCLDSQFNASYMQELRTYLAQRKAKAAVVFPHSSVWFNAFSLTPMEKVKVVILGQDPYHGAGQAHGLSFSVPQGVAIPPSLPNIFKEIDSDPALDCEDKAARSLVKRRKGCLEPWAEQGVFLLNSVLTVESGQAASHQGRGWESFTDHVIKTLSEQREHLVFLLWGSYAQKKGQIIDSNRHCVMSAPHPSPLSAHRGFFGCQHFSKANEWLVSKGETPIDWFRVA